MNQTGSQVGSPHPTECRLIINAPAPGAWNMGVDEALFVDAGENGVATLRFYRWSEPTLSLGYFQRYDDRQKHAPSRGCAVVRRQTGGGAILHDRELTYSLSLPAGHRLARQTEKLYAAVRDAFITALMPTLTAGEPHWKLTCCDQESNGSANRDPFLCFQRRARGDVLLTSPAEDSGIDWKILGSAQRRHRGAILQHGSLLLGRSPAAPELPGLRDLTGRAFAIGEIATALSVRLAAALDARLFESPLPPKLESKAEELANSKYGSRGWTNRR